jgi:hypothetical protein
MNVQIRGLGYGLLALVAGSTVALGQTGQIRVERKIGTGAWTLLSNTTPGLANPISININQGSPTIPADTNVFIRVYDTDTTTLDDIGRVTMAGALPHGTGRVKLSLWRNFTQDFAQFADSNILERAGASWSGLSFNSLPANPLYVFMPTPDVAGSGPVLGRDGELTADDIIVFIGWFTGADSRADVASAGPVFGGDGQLTADDIILFISWYTGDLTAAALPPCVQCLLAGGGEGQGESQRDGAARASAPGEAPESGPEPSSPASPASPAPHAERAAQVARLQGMIAAEPDAQRRAALQTMLTILQNAPVPGGSDER